MPNYVCPQCGISFHRAWTAKFCSRKCYGIYKGGQEELTCLNCNKTFFNQPSDHSKYCSKACMIEHKHSIAMKNRVEFDCEICGKRCSVRKTLYESVKNHYCSLQCSAKGKKKFPTKYCEHCGAAFYPVFLEQKFCSGKCKGLAHRSKRVLYRCKQCQKRFWAIQSNDKNRVRKFCSVDCSKKYFTGPRHHRWEGGRSHMGGYSIVRRGKNPKRVKKNGYILEHVLIMEAYLGRPLDYHGVGHRDNELVHHVDRDKKNNKISNLELCIAHEHARYHANTVVNKDCP